MRHLAQLYSLSVCFVSAIIMLVASALLILAIVNITFFDLRNENSFKIFDSNELYLSSIYGHELESAKTLTPQQLTELRMQKKINFISSEKIRFINNIIDCIIWIIVSLLFAVVHFKIYQRQHKLAL